MILVLDIAAIFATLAAAALWFAASRAQLRRVTRSEEFDYHDINRLVVSFNRVQILNSRAAFATGVSALLVGARFALAVWTG